LVNKLLGGFLCAALTVSALSSADAPATLGSGIDMQYVDSSVRPQDDFYRYVNGKWSATVAIPADKARWGSFDLLSEQALDLSHDILEGLEQSHDAKDPDQVKLAELYASFMDEARTESLGDKPLSAEFERIDAIRSKHEIPKLIAHLNRINITAPYTPAVHQDAKDPTTNVFDIVQNGLGMPDRDYYLLDDAKLKQARDQYVTHVTKMMQWSGDKSAADDAQRILALETRMAKVQWTRVENRNPIKVYNKVAISQLSSLTPGYDWKAYLGDAGLPGSIDYVIVHQPTYISGFNEILRDTPLSVWKTYFRWHVLSDYSPFLSKQYAQEHFAYYGKSLRGIEQQEVRWKRGVRVVENSLGEALGRLYVAKYFPAESKARMDQLVKNLLAAYRADISTLEWMGPETRQKANEKLAKFTTKIAYPSKWRDYSALKILKDDLVGNVERAATFEYERNIHKLGKPVDKTEWRMTPQTVNAYYSPERNEIVFPAAILQPPFFDPKADDAVNYGGIGAVIGHEISHGFDDQGSQYDGDGKLLDAPGWFTQSDLDQFKVRTHALVEQYSAYTPVAGFHLNGQLTLGENIGDNSGMAIAYKAYQLSLGGKPAPVIDGLTGDQRFYFGWAQVWRGSTRESELVNRIKTDPHSPSDVRGSQPERNQASFYEAFGIKPGDKMYLPPDQRVLLW
jgi:putative endopeptidase